MRWWREHRLALVLAIIWVLSIGAHGWVTSHELSRTVEEHGGEWTVHDWLVLWAFEWFNGWTAEVAGVLLIVVLSAKLVFKGSAESRDSNDELMDRMAEVTARLERIESQTKEWTNGHG